MTAGSIAVPTVIPLRPPVPGRPKSSIDSNTKIELKTETPGTDIYYTINGWKPDPFQRTGDRYTMKYLGPFTLPAGKQTVKAVAVSRDGLRESNVVTKIFEVDYVSPASLPAEDDEHGFQVELNRSRAKGEVDRTKAKIGPRAKSAWTDVRELRATQQRLTDMEVSGSLRHKPYSDMGHLTARNENNHNFQDSYATSVPQPYIFNGIGSQDLRWATHSQFNPSTQTHSNPTRYPTASDFLNFTTTSAGQYPGGTKWLPVNVSPAGFIIPSPQGIPGVGSTSLKDRRMSQDVGTQTVGLFYPSQKQIDMQKEQLEEKLALERQMRDRQPLLTAVSPGRGYWRKQIEHICQHLKAHTHNDAAFRALIGEPRMGKMLSSTIRQDEYELSLTLTFALRNSKDSLAGKQHGLSKSESYLNTHSQQDNQMYSEDEESEDEETVTSRSAGVRKVRKPKPKPKNKSPKLSPINAKLFKLLESKADVPVDEVQQLLDEGADPNCLNKSEMSPLIVAVKNRHVDAIDVLVRGGADVNAKGPNSIKGNTALHEAVSLGPSGVKVVEALLQAGADQNMKNEKGETAHDLAVKAGYESISKCLISALGQSQLEKMTKP
ncbi:unnamed protein product [Candidula unifasciata]|uniref:Uncharacterized protein n=1 Tax=Candidula unifasciata TaxID=100452 RepID=A0A8S3ZGU3_9EUPU|nr:unnamed protein product [Candidula unifasciata]